MVWGRNVVANSVPASIDFPLFSLFDSSFPAYKGLMMAISVAMFVFLYLALKHTRIGLVIRAALTHPNMVSALGHDVPGVFVLVFAIGSALAGLAGVIGGVMLMTPPTLAHAGGAIVFVVGVVGGLGSLAGALIAVLLFALPLLPGRSSEFARSLLTQMAIAAVFALSFNVLFGNTGLLSFGHAVYFGLGAYAAVHCMRAINHGLPIPMLLVPLAGAAG